MHKINIIYTAILSIIQGIAELLPISSSAHVILAEKFMGLKPSSPEMTFLLVMLHTGTMLAVLVFFFPRWKKLFSRENKTRWEFLKKIVKMLVIATAATGILGLGFLFLIEKVILKGHAVEDIFSNNWIIGVGLAAAGILIILSGRKKAKGSDTTVGLENDYKINGSPAFSSLIIGLVQGLALPFRGFSRSGSTISTGLFLGQPRRLVEEFSFALSIILTPAVDLREYLRLLHNKTGHTVMPFAYGIIGMILSFFAGLIAITWLTSWLEKGRWEWFGFYCAALAIVIFGLTGFGII